MKRGTNQGIAMMNGINEPVQNEGGLSPSKAVLIIMGYILLLPSWVVWDPYTIQVMAVYWGIILHPYSSPLDLRFSFYSLSSIVQRFLYMLAPALIFSYFMYRLYTGKTTVKRAFTVGLVTFFPLLVILFAAIQFFIGLLPFLPIALPIPLHLIFAYAVVKILPPPRESLSNWIDE